MIRLRKDPAYQQAGLKLYWDAVWAREPEWKPGAGIETERFAALTSKISAGARVLDVGGGRGEVLRWLRNSSRRFSGHVFDASPIAAKEATARGFIGESGDFAPGKTLFRSDSFHNVISGNMLGAVPDPAGAVIEMIRVCMPGGWVSISMGVKHAAACSQNIWLIEQSDFEEWLPGCECSYIGDKVHIVCHWRKP